MAGSAAPGVSSGDAMLEMERLAAQVPDSFMVEWTGQSPAGEAIRLADFGPARYVAGVSCSRPRLSTILDVGAELASRKRLQKWSGAATRGGRFTQSNREAHD